MFHFKIPPNQLRRTALADPQGVINSATQSSKNALNSMSVNGIDYLSAKGRKQKI